ncbi:hypothetical protein GCM10023310_69160 [Paenibacillus vulneris]
MFKKRLNELLLFTIGFPLILAAWVGICSLLISYTPIIKMFDFIQDNKQIVFGLIFAVIVLTMIYKFIMWLFIEPYIEYRRTKTDKR